MSRFLTTAAKTRYFAFAIWWRSQKPSEALSNLAIIGRYILTPDVFTSIARVEPGAGGEIQPTRSPPVCALKLLRGCPVYALGSMVKVMTPGISWDSLQATVEFALQRHDLGENFRAYLKSLAL